MIKNYTIITNKLYKHSHEIKDKTSLNMNNVLGIFLYGSQNYNANLEGSDVDSKMIYIPSLKELCLDKPISKEVHLNNGEHCEIKDIREMVKMFKKQNINFLEILFTDYFILNPKYEKNWNNTFIKNRDKIVRLNPRATINSILGQVNAKIRRGIKNDKEISNALRFIFFLRFFLAGKDYKTCIDIKSYGTKIENLIMDLKMGKVNEEMKSAVIKDILKNADILADRLDDYPLDPDKTTAALIDQMTVDIITNNNSN